MISNWHPILEWLWSNPSILWWLGAYSAAMTLASVIVVPVLVVRLPQSYLTVDDIPDDSESFSTWNLTVSIAKSGIGLFLLLAGTAMLVLPGQGLLTMAIGLALVSFPRKRNLVRFLLSRRHVLSAVNRLRVRAGAAPLCK